MKHFDKDHAQFTASRPHARARRGLLALAGAVFVLASVACTGIAAPSGWAAPATTDGLLIVSNKDGTVSGVRTAGAGEPAVVWTFPEEAQDSNGGFLGGVRRLFTGNGRGPDFSALYATPLVETVDNQQRVYVASYAGFVVALDPASGKPVEGWPAEVDVGAHVAATPAFDGTRLYLPTHQGEVKTVDVKAGTVGGPLVRTDARVWSQPVLAGGLLYVSSLDHRVRAVDPVSGEVRWSADVGGAIAGNPTVAGDLLVVPTLRSQVVALDLKNGEQRWAFTGDNWFWARPLVASDTVYAASTEGTVYALELATGREKWRYTALEGEVRATPVLSAGAVVVATRDGFLAALDPATGAERWRREVEGASFLADPLVLESGILYAADDGSLYRVTAQDQGTADVLLKRGK